MTKRNGALQETFSEKYWWLAFAASIIGIAVITVTLTDIHDLPLTIIGAVLGVAMTVFATYFLFKGQSRQQIAFLNEQKLMERKQEREGVIFKQKLEIYQKFLDALCAYIETKTDASKAKLKFQTAALAMHSEHSQQIKINNTIGKILSLYDGKEPDDKELIANLFAIADYFRQELYKDKASPSDEEKGEFLQSIEKLADAIQNSDSASNPEIDRADEDSDALEIAEATETGVEPWDSYIRSNPDWDFTAKKGSIIIKSRKTEAAIEFKMKGGYYVVEASVGENKEVPVKLKELFNGKRSGAVWWKPLNTLRNYRVKSNALPEEIETNDGARALVIRWFDRLSDNLTAQ
ncbi:MAG: hypothetical protein K2K97_03605 [Muribaculaceae bacterium]|nr:hypothetical protein [Muribaculaceae bacterium]